MRQIISDWQRWQLGSLVVSCSPQPSEQPSALFRYILSTETLTKDKSWKLKHWLAVTSKIALDSLWLAGCLLIECFAPSSGLWPVFMEPTHRLQWKRYTQTHTPLHWSRQKFWPALASLAYITAAPGCSAACYYLKTCKRRYKLLFHNKSSAFCNIYFARLSDNSNFFKIHVIPPSVFCLIPWTSPFSISGRPAKAHAWCVLSWSR